METALVQSREPWEGHKANAKGLTKNPVMNFLAVREDKTTCFRQRLISAWPRRSLSRLCVTHAVDVFGTAATTPPPNAGRVKSGETSLTFYVERS